MAADDLFPHAFSTNRVLDQQCARSIALRWRVADRLPLDAPARRAPKMDVERADLFVDLACLTGGRALAARTGRRRLARVLEAAVAR